MALSERDRRTVTIGGIVVGVLLAGFVLFSVLGGGEEPPPTAAPPLPPDTGRRAPRREAGCRRSRASPGGTPSPSRPPFRPRLRRRFQAAAGAPSPSNGGGAAGGRLGDAFADGARRRLEPERRWVHGRPARHLPAGRGDPRAGRGRRHRLRRGRRRAVRGRTGSSCARWPGTAPRSSSATSDSRLCINAQK